MLRVLVPILLTLLTSGAHAAQLDPTPVRVLTGPDAWPWERVECYRDVDPHFVQEGQEAADSDFSDNDQLAFGGDRTPHSGQFLLHYARGWRTATRPVPVLLCPGAIRSATSCASTTVCSKAA